MDFDWVLRFVGLAGVVAVVAIVVLLIVGLVRHNARVVEGCTERGLTYYEHAHGGFCIDRDGRLYGL